VVQTVTADVAAVTTIYDHYDILKPVLPQTGLEVDWVFVTDDPVPDTLGWRQVHEEWPGLHPNRAAKQAKLRPWEYTDAPASIWLDASVRVTSENFAERALALAGEIGQFVHPWRSCLFDEAEADIHNPKYTGEPVIEQAAHYRSLGHPAGWGLWATTVIVRQHTPAVREMGEQWAREIERWSFQDQVSQPFVLRNAGLRPTALPGDHVRSEWTIWEGSARH
jgi:hypothetical protein